MDSMALGLISHRESRKDLWARLMTLLLLYFMLVCTLLKLQRPLKMLVFDRTRLSPLFWHFAAQSTYTALLAEYFR